jgi:ElaA protein
MSGKHKWLHKHWADVSKEELYAFTELRIAVFVIEQDCPYPEFDRKDQKSWHIWTGSSDRVIAYLRIVDRGESYDEYSIGRVVVDEAWRSTGLGVELMQEALKFIEQQFGKQKIRISAQEYLGKWYGKLGFEQVSDVYLEDNIPHMEMLYSP